MKRKERAWLGVGAAVFVLLMSSAAHAQSGGVAERTAREAFERGNACFDAQDFACAAREYRTSVDAFERASVLFNLATALSRLGRWVDTLATVQRFLIVADVRRDARLIERAQALAAEARRTVGRLRVVVDSDVATLDIDNQSVALPMNEARDVDPGPHTIFVSAPRMIPAEREVEVAPGQTLIVDMSLDSRDEVEREMTEDEATSNAPAVVAAPVEGSPEQTPLVKKPWFWVTITAAVAVVATSVTLGVVLSRDDEPQDVSTTTGVTIFALSAPW